MEKNCDLFDNKKYKIIENLISSKKLSEKEEKEILIILKYLENNYQNNLEDFSLLSDIKTLCKYI